MPFAREMAAVLGCGRRTAVSHDSAGYVWALLPEQAGAVHLTSRHPHRRPGITVHRIPIDPHEVTRCRGIPVTDPARTVTDLACRLDAFRMESVLAEAGRRRLLTPPQLLASLERFGQRRGAAALRRITDRQRGPALTRSRAERRLLQLVRAAGLPEPDCNVAIGSYVPDFLWPDRRLIVETDGFEFHSSRAAFEGDRARDAERQADGFRVLRFTWRQLEHQPERVVALLAQTLARGAG